MSVKEADVYLIQELPKNLTVDQNETAVLLCILSKPDLKVQWFKDGKQITEANVNIKIETKKASDEEEGKYIYQISIFNCTNADIGKYKLEYKTIQTEGKLSVRKSKRDNYKATK